MVQGKIGLVKDALHPPSPSFTLVIGDAFDLRRYLTRDIIVQEKFPVVGYMANVVANGQEACFKVGTTIHGKAVQREFESIVTISYSKYASSTKVPKHIRRVVGNDEIIGILEELVSSKHTLGKILVGSAAPAEKITRVLDTGLVI